MNLPPATPPPGCPAHVPHRTRVRSEVPENALFGAEFTANPTAVYARLREQHGAVAPVVLEGGVDAFLVMGYHEVLSVLRDPVRFPSNPIHWQALKEGRIPSDWTMMAIVAPRPNVRYVDDDDTPGSPDHQLHSRLRGAITFSLRKVNERRLRIATERIANQLISEFSSDGIDLIADYAGRIPSMVMINQLGLGRRQAAEVLTLVDSILGGGPESVPASADLESRLLRLAADRRGRPVNDIPSWMVAAPQRLNDEEVMQQLWLVLVAGLGMCQSWIGNTLREMLTSNLHTQISGARLTIRDALDRVLWDQSPLQALTGRYTRSTGPAQHLGRYEIPPGEMLIVGMAAASSDPLLRSGEGPLVGNRSYPVFGSGPHACPAESIAEIICATAVEHLLHRVPDIQLAVPPEELVWQESLLVRGLVALPVSCSHIQSVPTLTAQSV
jgi:cytochrome P450